MKKIAVLLIAFILCTSLAGCGKGETKKNHDFLDYDLSMTKSEIERVSKRHNGSSENALPAGELSYYFENGYEGFTDESFDLIVYSSKGSSDELKIQSLHATFFFELSGEKSYTPEEVMEIFNNLLEYLVDRYGDDYDKSSTEENRTYTWKNLKSTDGKEMEVELYFDYTIDGINGFATMIDITVEEA